MKKLFFLPITFLILSTKLISAQTFNQDYLDGTVMFKLNYLFEPNVSDYEKTDDGIGLVENISDYPYLNDIFDEINILSFERPSYFTGKRELQKIYRIVFTEFEKIDYLIEKLNENNNIEYAEKEPIYKNSYVPNDPYHFGNNKWYHTQVNSEDAWDLSLGNENIKIAIVDNAIASEHLDLNVFKQRDVADNDFDTTPPQTYNQNSSWSHGTHCAGLATAEINNAVGIASLGGNSQLIAVKATGDNQNPGLTYYGYAGVQWACENGANVVSMSYGSEGSSNAMQELINSYPEVVFLAAAGNDNNSNVNYPAGYDNVIGVGSVDFNDNRSSFSNYNGSFPFWVDIASPGGFSYGGLLSTVYTNDLDGYAYQGGTSMATPFAAGLVGLMLSVNPSLTPSDVLSCLISSGVNINQDIGPRIDAYSALLCVMPESNNPIPAFTASPQVVYQNNSVNFSNYSANGNNWSWSFEGGTPSSFQGQNPPEIFYNNIGTYDVTLTISNDNSEQILTKEDYIQVFIEPSGEWILQNTAFDDPSRGINYISIVDENTVWGTAYDGSGSGSNIQEFTKTNNGGNTWTSGTIDIGNESLGISMIHALDYDTAWLVAYPTSANNVGGIFKTNDGGQTWSRQDSANYNTSSSFANVVYFWDENIGFAQGDPINGDFELYVTNDGGENWSQVPGNAIPNPLGGEYGYTRQIEVVGDNVWFTTNRGRVYHSTDKGNNWEVYNSPISDFGSAQVNGNLSFSNSQNGVIVDNLGNLYKSTNGGSSWSQISTNGDVFSGGLCYIEGTDIIFTTGSGSSFSTDGGYNWNPIDLTQHTYVEFLNETVGWSGGFNQDFFTGGIWKWEDLALNTEDFTEDNFEISYYPNPVENLLNINYEKNILSTIYDITGKKLLESSDKNIDLSTLQGGVYILHIVDLESNSIKYIKIIKK